MVWLRKHRSYNRWSEKQLVLYERKLMLIAFQIRSLLERPKVAKRYATKGLRVRQYPKSSRRPFTKLDPEYWEYFDMNASKQVILSAPQVCNQIIHHHLMFARSDKAGQFTSLLVTSDYKRHSCLFKMNLSDLVDFFGMFAKEESALSRFGTTVTTVWNEKKKDYDFVEASAQPKRSR